MGPVLSPTGQHGNQHGVDCTVFETELEGLKQSKKRKNSDTLLYIEDNFFDECKRWLQSTPEEKKHLNIDKQTKQKLARNKTGV